MRRRPIITIDGPAGAGKSTIARLIADWLSYVYLDTGALYRAVAYDLTRKGYPQSASELSERCGRMQVKLTDVGGKLHVFVDGDDVTAKIRTEEIGLLASRISAIPDVRRALLSVQRRIGEDGGLVAEGRDMGTVVFADAEIKFFLDASAEERAGRRYRELLEKGDGARLQDVQKDLHLRDRMDRERPIAPLMAPPDAIRIDTTNKTITQVIDQMKAAIEGRCHTGGDDRCQP